MLIENIEYNLPEESKNWKIIKDFQTKESNETVKSATIMHIPAHATMETLMEYFSVHVNSIPGKNTFDKTVLQKSIQSHYPKRQVTITIYENTPESTTYEWSIGEEGSEEMVVFTKALYTDKGCALLTYQTMEEIEDMETLRSIWIKALKSAKLK